MATIGCDCQGPRPWEVWPSSIPNQEDRLVQLDWVSEEPKPRPNSSSQTVCFSKSLYLGEVLLKQTDL